MAGILTMVTNGQEESLLWNNTNKPFYRPFYSFVRDGGLYRHCLRVAVYSVFIAAKLGLAPEEQRAVFLAGHFHDLGKVKMPADLLNKREPLNKAERRLMETHPSYSMLYLCRLVDDRYVLDAVLHHHERYDGSGYPLRLEGENIPLAARILAIADAFDDLVTALPRCGPLRLESVIDRIEQSAGSRCDPEMVDTFVSNYCSLILKMSQ